MPIGISWHHGIIGIIVSKIFKHLKHCRISNWFRPACISPRLTFPKSGHLRTVFQAAYDKVSICKLFPSRRKPSRILTQWCARTSWHNNAALTVLMSSWSSSRTKNKKASGFHRRKHKHRMKDSTMIDPVVTSHPNLLQQLHRDSSTSSLESTFTAVRGDKQQEQRSSGPEDQRSSEEPSPTTTFRKKKSVRFQD